MEMSDRIHVPGSFNPGNQPVINWTGGRFGPSVCSDLKFLSSLTDLLQAALWHLIVPQLFKEFPHFMEYEGPI
jgi:hypothetical protein